MTVITGDQEARALEELGLQELREVWRKHFGRTWRSIALPTCFAGCWPGASRRRRRAVWTGLPGGRFWGPDRSGRRDRCSARA